MIIVNGTASLDGTLNVSLINEFVPAVGNSFQIMTFGSRSPADSDFPTKNGLNLTNGLVFTPVYHPTDLTLTTVQTPTITTNPTNQTVTAGQTATFMAAASGNPTPTVQWQVSTDGGKTFSDIAGATIAPLSFTATAAQNGDEYRAVFGNSVGAATTGAATLTVDFAPTVTSSPTNQTVNAGDMTSFTAAASDGNPTPTTVQWQVSTNGGKSFSNIAGATSTTLSFTATAAQNGDEYQAVFSNTASLNATTSAATLTVKAATANTTTMMALSPKSPNPSVFGQSVTFTATVNAVAPASGTPTGSVAFLDGSITLGTATLSTGGKATLTTKALPAGLDPITAVYSGDSNFSTSTSTALTQTVYPDATKTTVASSANPSVFGQAVHFTATVKAVAPGSGVPTGTVTFVDGSTFLGTATLGSGGKATFTTRALPVGSHTITVSYGGDSNFITSTSTALTQAVNQDATKTTVASSANPSVSGQPITFTATVKAVAPGSGVPTGTVTFFDGSTSLGNAAALRHGSRHDLDREPCGRVAHDHGVLRRRRQLHRQRLSGPDPDRQPGRHEDDRHLFGQSVRLR